MLSTSQHQNCAYNLTARILGDPRPDREALSERLRSRVKVTGTTPENRPTRTSPVLKVHYVLRAISQGYSNVKSISDAIGVKHSTAGSYAREVSERGWATSHFVVAKSSKACVYEITDLGRRELKRVEGLL